MGTPYFSDTFTRIDSNTVGNGWVELNGGTAPAAEQIFSNALRLGGDAVISRMDGVVQEFLYSNVQRARRLSASVCSTKTCNAAAYFVYEYSDPSNFKAVKLSAAGFQIIRYTLGSEIVLAENATPVLPATPLSVNIQVYRGWVTATASGVTIKAYDTSGLVLVPTFGLLGILFTGTDYLLFDGFVFQQLPHRHRMLHYIT